MLILVDERGRITLPKKIREKLKIKSGDYLMLDIQDGVLIGKVVVPIERPHDFSLDSVKKETYTKEELLEHIKDLASVSGKQGS